MEHQHHSPARGAQALGRCRTETAPYRGKWNGDSSPETRKNDKSSKTLNVAFILDSCFTPALDDTEFSINPRLLLRDGVVSPEIVPTCPKMSPSRAGEGLCLDPNTAGCDSMLHMGIIPPVSGKLLVALMLST